MSYDLSDCLQNIAAYRDAIRRCLPPQTGSARVDATARSLVRRTLGAEGRNQHDQENTADWIKIDPKPPPWGRAWSGNWNRSWSSKWGRLVHSESTESDTPALPPQLRTPTPELSESEHSIVHRLQGLRSERAMLRSMSLITKVVSTCNLACRYCDQDIYSKRRMSFETLAFMTKRALMASSSVEFIWHGGEPLLRGRHFFEQALWLQNEMGSPSVRVHNRIQTNGIPAAKVFDNG